MTLPWNNVIHWSNEAEESKELRAIIYRLIVITTNSWTNKTIGWLIDWIDWLIDWLIEHLLRIVKPER